MSTLTGTITGIVTMELMGGPVVIKAILTEWKFFYLYHQISVQFIQSHHPSSSNCWILLGRNLPLLAVDPGPFDDLQTFLDPAIYPLVILAVLNTLSERVPPRSG